MTRRLTIPTEILRSLFMIVEKGSLTKAAPYLGLSQPAISSQIKRLESMVGGPIFVKSINGSALTQLGKLVLVHAKTILRAHDQLIAIGGSEQKAAVPRIGLSGLLVRRFIDSAVKQGVSNFQLQSDHSSTIMRELLVGRLDVACIFHVGSVPEELDSFVIRQSEQELSWVRSQSFALSPGAYLPIITWSADDWITTALQASNTQYKIVFNGLDIDARKAAVEAGLGVTALPTWLVQPPLFLAKEYYLPRLPLVKLIVCERPGLAPHIADDARQIISELVPKNQIADVN